MLYFKEVPDQMSVNNRVVLMSKKLSLRMYAYV